MRFHCIFLCLATLASAQYAITDLMGHEKGASLPLQGTGLSPQTPEPSMSQQLVSGGLPSSIVHAANPMAAMLASVAGASVQSQGQAIPQDSMAVVSGLVESFMHKVELQPGEKTCLKRNMGQVTGDLTVAVEDIVTAVKSLMEGKNNQSGNVVSAGIDSATKIASLVSLTIQLVQTCVHGDTYDLLKQTANHMINGTYLEHQFLVNGVDIAHYLADSVTAFEADDFHRFGKDIGISLRKILLSKNTNATRLPEGMPDRVVIQKATDGLMRGFFVSGSAVRITDTAQPDVDIVINLHQCIAGNSDFFKELWMAAWDLVAQLSLNGFQHGFGLGQHDSQPKWQGELMLAMTRFPTALTKCGVAQDMQTMFMEALKSLNDVNVQFKFPDDHFQMDKETTDRMAKAVEAWTEWNFEGFGFELGTLLRELVMIAFPQKYAVDASGRLWLQEATPAAKMAVSKKSRSVVSASIAIIGGAVAALLVAFTAMRARRFVHLPLADCESGLTFEDIEEDVHNRLEE